MDSILDGTDRSLIRQMPCPQGTYSLERDREQGNSVTKGKGPSAHRKETDVITRE